jgi:hypothetical protein
MGHWICICMAISRRVSCGWGKMVKVRAGDCLLLLLLRCVSCFFFICLFVGSIAPISTYICRVILRMMGLDLLLPVNEEYVMGGLRGYG